MQANQALPIVTALILSDDLGDSQYDQPRRKWIERDRFARPPWIILAPFDSLAKPGAYSFGIYTRFEGLRLGDRLWHSITHVETGRIVWQQSSRAERDVLGPQLGELEGVAHVQVEFMHTGIYRVAVSIGQNLGTAEALASMRLKVHDGSD